MVDVARDLRAGPEVSTPRAFARVAAVPAWVWLTGIVVASFGGRLFAAVARLTPYYLPDEYIYPSLARSLAESGRPLIRGAGVHFPALLDPIVTAPVWLVTNDPVTAFRLTQGIHAVLFSLAAIPAYLLCRRLGLSSWLGIAVAALTVAVPDGVYSSTMLADPLAYPLVLSAVYAGVCVVSEPTLRAQLAFAVFSALSVFARIQYVIVPVAVLAAELVADRFNVVRAVRRVWLALSLLIVPPALLLATLGSERLFGVYANGDHAIHAGSILRWVGLEAMLLTYSSGWVIVPGALAGVAVALFRPRTRAEHAFAVTSVVLAGGLLLEAAQIADTDSQRFQERYLFTLVPLLAIAFCLYVKRGLPGRIPVGLLSAGLLLLAARIPLSGYATAHNKDDSPTLWAVLRLEGLTSVGNGSLAIALVAAVLSVLGALIAFRKVPVALALVAAVVACCAMSAGASAFDAHTSRSLRSTLPHDIRWVDHARLGNVDLLAPPGALREQSWQQLFWNTSVKRLLLLGSAPIDQFDAKPLRVARRRHAARGRQTRPPAAARPDLRVDCATQRRRARPARADLRPLPAGWNAAPPPPRRRPIRRPLARSERARSRSGRRPAARSTSCSRCRLVRRSRRSSSRAKASSGPSACIPGNASRSASRFPREARGAFTSARRARAISASAPSACAPSASASVS